MSRVIKPYNKFMNLPPHEAEDVTPSKVRLSFVKGADYHKASSFKSWLMLKHNMTYKAYQKKRTSRKHALRVEYEQDTGRKHIAEQTIAG